MKTKTRILLALAASTLTVIAAEPQTAKAEKETRYLAFQIFTNYSTDPKDAQALNNGMREPLTPGRAALRSYVLDIKQRIGIVGDRQTRLAIMLGPLTFDQTDAEITKFIERAFDLALETDMAVGFHIDDCILWSGRKDLWSDPKNVEAVDWDETPCTGRRLNYGKTPMEVAPQMCFNSKAIQHEVRQRAALIGKAIAAEVKKLEQLKRPEMFAGVISGWETQMGSDLKTGKYLGYRALLNRGFSREHPPKDMASELENVTQEFIELWTTGLAEAGIPPQTIYSHIAFLSRRAFGMGDNKQITYMKRDKDTAYSQHNHYTPPSVAFGKNHRPGFSTYPQPGLFDDIYELLTKNNQMGWASCEGTNMQPSSGPGQTGMNMETYLAKMFNHGGTLVDIFSWGIGGEAHKTMGFRVATEGEEALQAYRKFLKGEPLIEAKMELSLDERLPLKVHKIQAEFSAWMQKADTNKKDKATALMQKLQQQARGKDPQALERTADSILELMGVSAQPSTSTPATGPSSENKPPQTPPSSPPTSTSPDARAQLSEKIQRLTQAVRQMVESGRDPADIHKTMHEKIVPLLDAGKVSEAGAELDRLLEQINKDGKSTESSAAPAKASKARQPGARDFRQGLISGFELFKQTSVQQELQLSDDQIKKLEAYEAERRESYQRLRDLDPKERAKKLAKASVEGERTITEILKSEQIKRFQEIMLQNDGIHQSVDAKDGVVAAALKLTDDQEEKFKSITQEMVVEREAFIKAAGRDRGKMDAKMQELRKSGDEKLMQLLTEVQKAKWKELIGAPFKVELDAPQGGPRPEAAKTGALTLEERLPLKVHKIQEELPAWMEKADPDAKAKAMALMQKLQEQVKGKDPQALEETADAILNMMGMSVDGAENKPPQTPPSSQSSSPSSDDTQKRLTEKLQRVMQGANKWTASGRDISDIRKTMDEKFKPLIEAGKVVEAEAELDRLLEQLKQDGKSTESPAAPAEATHHATQDITEEVRETLAHNIGISFLLFRTKAQGELKVTQEQKEKLDQYLRTLLPEAMQVLQKSNGERGKYNQKTHEDMAAVLKEILNEGQRTRLHQLELQKDGLFGPEWNMKELQITDTQRQQFIAPTQETQQKTKALMEEIHKGANPDKIRPKALQLRLDLEVQLESLLTDAQKNKWKEMLGQPVDPSVLYGGVSSR